MDVEPVPTGERQVRDNLVSANVKGRGYSNPSTAMAFNKDFGGSWPEEWGPLVAF